METEDIKKNELDYNDGLGSILSKKGSFEFSWVKTIGVLSVLLLFILMGSHLVFNFGREMIQTNDHIVDLGNYTEENVSEFSYQEPKSKETTKTTTSTQNNQSNIKPHSKTDKKPNSLNSAHKEKKVNIKKTHSITFGETAKDTISHKSKQPQLANFKLIVGTFRQKQNAITARDEVLKKGFSSFIRVSSKTKDGNPLYLVQAGAFNRLEDAKTFKTKLSQKNINGYILKI